MAEQPDFQTRGFELFPWQEAAVDAWAAGAEPYRGTLEIFTGGGKSLIALRCAEVAARAASDFRLLVVVPTKALADQWVETVVRYTNVPRSDVGKVSGKAASTALQRCRVAVAIVNTAAALVKKKQLVLSDDTMLVVDECHRAGAATFRYALDLGRRFRLGLSATPEREELGDDGEPLQFDEQIVAKKLGGVVYSFSLADARRAGRLPEYRIEHHGIALLPEERRKYEEQTREVTDLSKRLRGVGADPGRARSLQSRPGEVGALASAYLAATSERKDLLYRASERARITLILVGEAMADPGARILIFNERIDSVDALANIFRSLYGDIVEAEHSGLPAKKRRAALDRFRTGSARILVSAKSLIEGIDVPEATVGISVASTASVRQRIQALGRVLRKGDAGKSAAMHVVYASDTADEAIYEKEDWSDLTGEAHNAYWRWSLDSDERVQQEGPPAKPRATEDQMAQVLATEETRFPLPWDGVIVGQEYSVDTKGNVKNAFGTPIANAQGVDAMVRAARGAAGGRFRVTPKHRFILVLCKTSDGFAWRVSGQLSDPFVALEPLEVLAREGRTDVPGRPYHGLLDKKNGEFKIRARQGGVIERKGRHATTDSSDSDSDPQVLRANLSRALDAWRSVSGETITAYINSEWDVWYSSSGVPTFICHAPGGFAGYSDSGNS